jgi:hypothetical protein
MPRARRAERRANTTASAARRKPLANAIDACLVEEGSGGDTAMIDLLFIALFQTAAGPPETQAAEVAPTEQTAESEQAVSDEVTNERRRCRTRDLTGTRLSTVITCRSGRRSGQQDIDTRDALHDVQRPVGWQPGDLP